MIIDRDYAEKLLYGSLILGCGGGGNERTGRESFEAAFAMAEEKGSKIELISVEELQKRNPDGGVIVTISGVGSPAATTSYVSPDYYPRLMELLETQIDGRIIGFVACEIGGSSTFEPFVPAALTGIPIVDAPCDGRAHPLGLMGALGLEKTGRPVVQVAVGGKKGEDETAGKYVEIAVKASVESAASLIRNAASQAGGFIAVARNPVDVNWLSENAAMGAYAQTYELGCIWKKMIDQGMNREEIASSLALCLSGEVIFNGTLTEYRCDTANALDQGMIRITEGESSVSVTFFNEYMTVETNNGIRKATFPDGIILIGEDGRPYSSAMLSDCKGKKFTLLATSYKNLKIPAGLRHRNGYRTVESILNQEMISFLDRDQFFLD